MYFGLVFVLWWVSLMTLAFFSWGRSGRGGNDAEHMGGDGNARLHRGAQKEKGARRERGEGRPDVIIVGAGVVGSALAYALGKDGRQVHVIERDLTEPDRIVGELLQPGGYLKLVELGLHDCVEKIDAQQVFGYALFHEGKDTKVSYPLEEYRRDVAGRGFHHGRFIQRMREKASSLPNVCLEQGTVTRLIEECGTIKGIVYKSTEGTEHKAYAPLTVVCDGCFSNLRRSLCEPKVDVPSCFVGLVLENCELPHPNHGHVILADPSPILFYPISENEIRCLVDIPGKKVPSIATGDMAKYLRNVVAPQLPHQLHEAFLSAVTKGNIKTMPNRSMPACPRPTPGALLMGDAFNMRHPLTGGGMTVALSDVVLISNLLKPLCDLNDAPSLCKYLESFYTLRKPVASTINTLAGALYKVFCASPDLAMREMRQACFDYLSLGGVFSSGPVALLSGLNPRPLSLVLHFFAVAVYGVTRLLVPFPSLKGVWVGARLLSGATNIIFPIIKAEGIRQMFFPKTVLTYYRSPPSKSRMVDSTPWSFDSTVLQILTGFMSFAVCGYSGVGHRATDIIAMTAAGGIIEEENVVIDGEWWTDEDTGVIVAGLKSEEDGSFILSASAAVVTDTVRAISSPNPLICSGS